MSRSRPVHLCAYFLGWLLSCSALASEITAPAAPGSDPCSQPINITSMSEKYCENYQPLERFAETKPSMESCQIFYMRAFEGLKAVCDYRTEAAVVASAEKARAQAAEQNSSALARVAGVVSANGRRFAERYNQRFAQAISNFQNAHANYAQEIQKLENYSLQQLSEETDRCGRSGYPVSFAFVGLFSDARVEQEANYERVATLLTHMFTRTRIQIMEFSSLVKTNQETVQHLVTGGQLEQRTQDAMPLANKSAEEAPDDAPTAEERLLNAKNNAMSEGAERLSRKTGAGGVLSRTIGIFTDLAIDFADRLAHRKLDFIGLVAITTKVAGSIGVGSVAPTSGLAAPAVTIGGAVVIDMAVSEAERVLRRRLQALNSQKLARLSQISQQQNSADSAVVARAYHASENDGLCGSSNNNIDQARAQRQQALAQQQSRLQGATTPQDRAKLEHALLYQTRLANGLEAMEQKIRNSRELNPELMQSYQLLQQQFLNPPNR